MKLREALSRRRRPLPVPPAELRDLIGGLGPERFDNPTRGLVYRYLPASAYESVFDFGSGCGRVARQLISSGRGPRGTSASTCIAAWSPGVSAT